MVEKTGQEMRHHLDPQDIRVERLWRDVPVGYDEYVPQARVAQSSPDVSRNTFAVHDARRHEIAVLHCSLSSPHYR